MKTQKTRARKTQRLRITEEEEQSNERHRNEVLGELEDECFAELHTLIGIQGVALGACDYSRLRCTLSQCRLPQIAFLSAIGERQDAKLQGVTCKKRSTL